MRDLDAIDQQLRELGEPPRDRPALIARVLGGDRSRERLEQLLGGLGAAAAVPAAAEAPAQAPLRVVPLPVPAPSPAPAAPEMPAIGGIAPALRGGAMSMEARGDEGDDGPDTEETTPSAAAAMVDAHAPDTLSDRPGESEDDYEPELSLGADSEPPPEPPPVREERSRFAAMFDFSQPPPARESLPSEAFAMRAPAPAKEPETPLDSPHAPGEEPAPADEETTARRSVPPPPAPVAAADDDADAEEADFELLVDDEDIIEIDDEEMQIVDDE